MLSRICQCSEIKESPTKPVALHRRVGEQYVHALPSDRGRGEVSHNVASHSVPCGLCLLSTFVTYALVFISICFIVIITTRQLHYLIFSDYIMHKLLTDKVISKWFISLCELCMFCISVGVALCYMLNLDTISPNDWDSVQFYIINLIKPSTY